MKYLPTTSGGVTLALLTSWGMALEKAGAGQLPEWTERLGWTLVHSAWQLAAVATVAALLDLGFKRFSANARYAAGVAALVMMVAMPCVTWSLIDIATRPQGSGFRASGSVGSGEPSSMAASSRLSDWHSVDTGNSKRPFEPESNWNPARDVSASLMPQVESNGLNGTLVPGGVATETTVSGSNSVDKRASNFWSRLKQQVRTVVEPRLTLFVALWFAGVLVCSLRPIWGLWIQWQLLRIGLSPIPDAVQQSLTDLARRMGLTRVVRIAESVCVAAPMVVGYLRPMILLPASVLTQLTPTQLESLLAHELAHVRRHDWLVNALQVVVETLLFYHPALWWLSGRIRRERELCCDDIALAVVGDKAAYGRMLLALEELRQASRVRALAAPASLAATGGDLVHRIRRLLPVSREAERASRGWLSGALALAVLGVSCGVWFATQPTADNTDLDKNVEPVLATEAPDQTVLEKPHATESATTDRGINAAKIDATAIETGDPQMLSWAILVDGILADSVANLGGNEFPQQGVFRVIQLDAARLRQTLFDSDGKDHTLSEVVGPTVLELSKTLDDRHYQHGIPPFQIKLKSGAVSFGNTHLDGKYLSMAGHPFELDMKAYALSIFESDPPHEIKSKSFSYRGEVPIGSAVAFVGRTVTKSGSHDFYVIQVYEAVPKVSEPARRLLADVALFKAGRARQEAALKQAETFNAKADKLPLELPKQWTKSLPHGVEATLVAVARPATHPFCWWDPDGQPRATDWTFQQHAHGPVELLALVCVRDPNATEVPQKGVTYNLTGNFPPLPLYRSWQDSRASELFLFSVQNTDDEHRPMVGVNVGVGPWKELGKLTTKEELQFGRADYILSAPQFGSDHATYRILGRRYLPDEDVRMRLIDKQGKSSPFDPNTGNCSVSDTQGVPANWDGWCNYQSEIKENEVDHIVLDSRPRHWTTFSGFATVLAAVDGGGLPKLRVAQPVAPASRSLLARLSTKFDEVLWTKYSGFIRDEDRAAIVEDLRRFTELHQPATLSKDRASSIVNGLDEVLNNNVGYLGFFPMYRSMKWRLWMALNPRDLTPEDVARRREQREELRKQIREIPITNFNFGRTHGHAVDQLEKLFNNPWHGWFHEPLSDEELAQMKRERKNWTINDIIFAHSTFDTIVMRVKEPKMNDDPLFGTGALPLDAEIIANLKPGVLRLHARYANGGAFYGIRDLVFDDAPQSRRRIFDWNKTFVDLPNTVPLGLEAVQKWAEENKTGLLAYESARHGLFMLRGAKLGLLPVETWQEADRLSDDDLFHIVGEQAKDSILLADHYGPRPTESSYGARPAGPLLVVESASGELGVVQVESISKNGITAHLRVRPGAKR